MGRPERRVEGASPAAVRKVRITPKKKSKKKAVNSPEAPVKVY
jgi:hypothetical protein